MQYAARRNSTRLRPRLDPLDARALLTSAVAETLIPIATTSLPPGVVVPPPAAVQDAPINPNTTVVRGADGSIAWYTPTTGPTPVIDYSHLIPAPGDLAPGAAAPIAAASGTSPDQSEPTGAALAATTAADRRIVVPLNISSAGTTPTTYVEEIYRARLGREPSAKDLSFWTRVATRYGDATFLDGVVSSAEYVAELHTIPPSLPIAPLPVIGSIATKATGTATPALAPTSTSPSVVARDFTSLLGRAATAPDVAFWTKVAADRGEFYVMEAITASPEHRSQMTTVA